MRILLVFIVLSLPELALAHARSTSYSYWDIQPAAIDGALTAAVTARVRLLDLTRIGLHPDADADFQTLAALRLSQDLTIEGCTSHVPKTLRIQDGWLSAGWTLHCPAGTPLVISSQWLQQVLPGHLHMLSVQTCDGSVQHKTLTGSARHWPIDAPVMQSGIAVLSQFFAVGVRHILSGWDHLAFLLGVLLLCPRLSSLLWAVTGFTIGHSITLGLSVLGLLVPVSHGVEVLIAISIIMVAAEAIKPSLWAVLALSGGLIGLASAASADLALVLLGAALFSGCYLQLAATQARLRILMIMLFGLIHGFGFASSLRALNWPQDEILTALLGFNLGVEAGQLLVLILAWPVLRWLRRQALDPQAIVTSSIAALGSYWLVIRVFS